MEAEGQRELEEEVNILFDPSPEQLDPEQDDLFTTQETYHAKKGY